MLEKKARLESRLKAYRNHVRDIEAGGVNVRIPDPTDITKKNVSPQNILELLDELREIDGNLTDDVMGITYGFDVIALRDRNEIRLLQV